METIDYNEMARDTRRMLEYERERMMEKLQQVDDFMKLMDHTDALVSKVESLQLEVEELNKKIDELHEQLDEKDLQLTEFSKLSAGVAKKSPQDELLKAFRTYINFSKRKTLSKRITVKMMIMEFANFIGLSFPEDIANTLNCLDDETEAAAPVTVNVAAGGINIQQANSVKG